MSLKTIDFVINDINANEKISNNTDMINLNHISEYYRLKSDYYNFLTINKAKKPTFEYSITGQYIINGKEYQGFRSNHPLVFLEKDGCLIIEVINDNTRELVYKKTINLQQDINIKNYSKHLVSKLKKSKHDISQLYINKTITNIQQEKARNQILYDQNILSKAEFNSSNNILEQRYNELRNTYNSLKDITNDANIELQVLNSLVKQKIDKLSTKFSNLKIKNTYLHKYLTTELYNNFKNNPNNNTAISYYITDKILYQKHSDHIYNGALCTDGNALYVVDAINNDETVSVYDVEYDKSIMNANAIKHITGLYYQLESIDFTTDLDHISLNDYNKLLLEKGIKAHSSIDTDVIIENKVGDTSFTSKIVQYLKNPLPIQIKKSRNIKKQVADKQESAEKIVEVSNIYADIENIDKETVLLIDNRTKETRIEEVGRLDIEKIKNTDKKAQLEKLSGRGDWRRKLSNNYVRTVDNKIIPIIIDNIPFASVKHYQYYSMFNDNKEFAGDKKRQHNQYAKKFTLNYDEIDGFSTLYGKELENVANNTDFEIKSDYRKNSGIKINGNDITFEKACVLKAMYAKAIQHSDIGVIFRYTLDADLLEFQNNMYKTAIEHIFIRYLLVNEVEPLFYKDWNYDLEFFKHGKHTEFDVTNDREIIIADSESIIPEIENEPSSANDLDQSDDMDTYKLYYVKITYNSKDYNVTFYHNSDDDQNIPVYITDIESGKSENIDYEKEMHENIVEIFEETEDVSLENEIEYSVDQNMNVLALTSSGINSLGKLSKIINYEGHKWPKIDFL